MEITKVAQRYSFIENRDVNCHLINHDILFKFFQQKQTVDPILRAASAEDKYALSLKVLLNYISFEFANCPLFLNSEFYYRENRLEKIEDHARKCEMSYPSISNELQNIISTLKIIKNSADNPLLENIEKFIGYNNSTLMLINPDYTQAVMEMCESYGLRISVSSPNAAEKFPTQKGIFCGCAKFFPSNSFYAPEFKHLHLVRFGWFHDHINGHPAVYGEPSSYKRPELIIKRKEIHPTVHEDIKKIELEDPALEFDVGMLHKYKARDNDPSLHDNVNAKVVMLRGGKFVFLPADDDYRHHCLVNLDALERGTPAVKKIPISEFNQYTAILLREKERGDYVTDMANKIMGSRAQAFRTQQQQWKKLLREKTEKIGLNQVSKELAAAGCKTGGYQNLRNWISPRFIRLLDDNDFMCLLKYLGLEADAPMLLRNMSLIRKTHTKAGHRISEQLRTLAQNDNNLKTLLSDGYRIYRTENGGKLGVFVFERSLSDTMTVSHTETGGVKTLEAVYG